MVLAPEHQLVDTLTSDEQRAAVDAYRTQAARATEIERLSDTREKTGVFTGGYAVNPVNGARIPVWIADYVLRCLPMTSVTLTSPASMAWRSSRSSSPRVNRWTGRRWTPPTLGRGS